MQYPIWMDKDADSDYSVIVPDLPGCFSAGKTIAEAIKMAHEAILCHIEGLLLDDEPIPERRPIEEHRRNREYRGGVWAVVDVDLSQIEDKAERINVTVPRRVLHIIDEAAKRAGETRSGYLTRAGIEAAKKRSA